MGDQEEPRKGSSADTAGGLPDSAATDIAVATVERLQASLLAGEERGDRLLQMYLTVLGAAGVGLGLVANSGSATTGPRDYRGLLVAAFVACVVIWILGLTSVIRIARCDVLTTRAINDLTRSREAAYGQLRLTCTLPWGDPRSVANRRWRWPGTAGGQLTFINSVIAALGAGCLMQANGYMGLSKLEVAVAALGVSCLVHCGAAIPFAFRNATGEPILGRGKTSTDRHRRSP